jgi:uncharacterized protein YndB with AHSA1/START domain
LPFQPDSELIRWRLHLRSSPATVYRALSTDAGRASFWAKSAVERDGIDLLAHDPDRHWDTGYVEN